MTKLHDSCPADTAAQPVREPRWSGRFDVALTRAALLVTLVAGALAGGEQLGTFAGHVAARNWGGLALHAVFLAIVAALIYGSLVYQLTRLGYLHRRREHRAASAGVLHRLYEAPAPALTILVPSFKEEGRVIYQTLMSAALQEYPDRRVVLLIDDPPEPAAPEDAESLAAARELPALIERQLRGPGRRTREAQAQFHGRLRARAFDPAEERRRLAALWREVALWFMRHARDQERIDHTDRLFVHQVLWQRYRAALDEAAMLERQALRGRSAVPELLRHYRRLVSWFEVSVTAFERKRYVNLSHEPNKAMNLNSYLGLIGRHLRVRHTHAGAMLDDTEPVSAEWAPPPADYVITLDADSLLAPDYALRLVHYMEQPGNERVAVAQTPYSAVPGASGTLERIAGATTDIQYLIHQGFSAHGATFWVGANALLRVAALRDIAVLEQERSHAVWRFIQDRTVIEDTESSVDLVVRGWTLYNYPERLAFSATPPDFGALIIQRRRWANGGLIILPKLLRYLGRGPRRLAKVREGFFRAHYLVSIAAVNVGLVLLLSSAFAGFVHSLWLPLSALPYFVLYARDLRHAGYRRLDVFRVYALNLLLIPVNLGGVAKSLHQAVTGHKIPFGRTPKVRGRTAAPALYVALTLLLLAYGFFGAGVDFASARWAHGVFAFLNASFLLYAVSVFVGWRAAREDLLAGYRHLRQRVRGRRATDGPPPLTVSPPSAAGPVPQTGGDVIYARAGAER